MAIEGIDGSAKATQSKLLAERLDARQFSFPAYETPLGQVILGNLQSKWSAIDRQAPISYSYGPGGEILVAGPLKENPALNALVLQSIFALNRYELAGDIYAAMDGGRRHVVLDRYWVSGVVYGTCDGLDESWLIKIHQGLPQPRAWILLDVPPEESVRRRPERRDRYEKDEHMGRRREIYLRLFNDPERWGGVNCFVIDGVGTIDQVHQRICTQLRMKFGRDFLNDKNLQK